MSENVRKGDRCEGTAGAARGKGYGKVEEVYNGFGDDEVTVKWDKGGKSVHKQWELRGTSVF